MAVTLSPQALTDTWTELPQKTDFKATTTRLQVLLLNIFQILEMECNRSIVAETDFQEAIRLVSEMKMLGLELEKKLQNTELGKCESGLEISAKTIALQEQIAGLEAKVESTDKENMLLEKLVVEKDEKLKAAAQEKEKLERLTQSLQTELQEKQKKDASPSTETESPVTAVPNIADLLLKYDTNLASGEEEILEYGSMKKNLEMHKKLLGQCDAEKERLLQLMGTSRSRQAAMQVAALRLDSALNISRLNNKVSRDELLKAVQVSQNVKLLMEQAQHAQICAINAMNYTDVVTQECARQTMYNHLADKVEAIHAMFHSRKRRMSRFGVPYREGGTQRLREVVHGRPREEAFFEATKKGDAGAVYTLLMNKVNPKKCDAYGYTPLQWAAHNGHVSVVQVLIQYGPIVDVDKPEERCSTITPLQLAAFKGHIPVAQLLMDLGADMDTGTSRDGSSALHLAAQEDRDAMVQLLMSRGANAYKKDHKGRTPIDLATTMKHYRIQKLLLHTKNEENV